MCLGCVLKVPLWGWYPAWNTSAPQPRQSTSFSKHMPASDPFLCSKILERIQHNFAAFSYPEPYYNLLMVWELGYNNLNSVPIIIKNHVFKSTHEVMTCTILHQIITLYCFSYLFLCYIWLFSSTFTSTGMHYYICVSWFPKYPIS